MKLDRLTSTARTISHETAERVHQSSPEALWRVGAIEGVDTDRERSLQQELEAAKARGGTPGTVDQPLQEAREMAEKLVSLGSEATQLLKPAIANPLSPSVDTQA